MNLPSICVLILCPIATKGEPFQKLFHCMEANAKYITHCVNDVSHGRFGLITKGNVCNQLEKMCLYQHLMSSFPSFLQEKPSPRARYDREGLSLSYPHSTPHPVPSTFLNTAASFLFLPVHYFAIKWLAVLQEATEKLSHTCNNWILKFLFWKYFKLFGYFTVSPHPQDVLLQTPISHLEERQGHIAPGSMRRNDKIGCDSFKPLPAG